MPLQPVCTLSTLFMAACFGSLLCWQDIEDWVARGVGGGSAWMFTLWIPLLALGLLWRGLRALRSARPGA